MVVLCRALKAIGHEVTILTDPVAAEPFRGLLRATGQQADTQTGLRWITG